MKSGMGAGKETRAVAEISNRTNMGTGTGSRRAQERRMSGKKHVRLVDAISPFYSTRVIISADRGWRLRAPDSSVRKAQGLYKHIDPRG